MAIGKSIRIYDLAREVKQDTKRVMEDVRREGADVSVASNSVSHEIAEKVRNKYFPKTEAAPKRTIKVIKAAAKKEEPVIEEETPSAEPVVEPEVPAKRAGTKKAKAAPAAEPEEVPETPSPKVRKLAKKVAEEPAQEPILEVEKAPTVKRLTRSKAKEAEIETPPETVTEVPAETAEDTADTKTPAVSPTGTTVKRLTLSPDALKQGIKPGERLVSSTPTKTGSLVSERPRPGDDRFRRPEFRGTPGESAAPQMTYTPPADNRRRPGRSGGRRGKTDDKGGKWDKGDIDAPQKRSIEERVMDQVGAVDIDNLRTARLTEGATVREFAEALGITPRDIVQLLIKKGVFATLNQPIGEKKKWRPIWASILATTSASCRSRKWSSKRNLRN